MDYHNGFERILDMDFFINGTFIGSLETWNVWKFSKKKKKVAEKILNFFYKCFHWKLGIWKFSETMINQI